jgi:hydroxyacylglutathione hydrolase
VPAETPAADRRVFVVPCGADNLAYLLAGDDNQAIVIDPGEAAPVLAVLRRERLTAVAMLFTHAHADHTAGAAGIRTAFPLITLYGWHGARERLPGGCLPLASGAVFKPAGLPVTVMHTPGHTQDSVCYGCGGELFTGDTLFGAGCGRLLGGSAAELHASLTGLVRTLPAATRVWYGHEYTVDNLRFALSILPDDPAIRERLAAAAGMPGEHAPLVPSTLALEQASNLFLRCGETAVADAAGSAGAEALAVFTELRRRKNAW